MQRVEKTVDTGLLLEEYRTLLETVNQLPLTITGSSMTPFLAPGRDSVMLTKPRRPLQCGDMVLYRRESGAYVLHRIWRQEQDGTFSIIGDGQTDIETGIREDQIFAVVQSATRKGKRQEPGCFWWEFFAHVWIHLIPLRPLLRRIYVCGMRRKST